MEADNEETWDAVMELPETKVAKIPKYIVNVVHNTIYDRLSD